MFAGPHSLCAGVLKITLAPTKGLRKPSRDRSSDAASIGKLGKRKLGAAGSPWAVARPGLPQIRTCTH
jgi:hypothetical protein